MIRFDQGETIKARRIMLGRSGIYQKIGRRVERSVDTLIEGLGPRRAKITLRKSEFRR